MIKVTLGIGCDRNVSENSIKVAVYKALQICSLNINQVVGVGSITLKQNENGLLSFINNHHWQITFFEPCELAKVDVPSPSEVVRKFTGTPSVATAAAILLAKTTKENLLLDKFKYCDEKGKNVTVAVVQLE